MVKLLSDDSSHPLALVKLGQIDDKDDAPITMLRARFISIRRESNGELIELLQRCDAIQSRKLPCLVPNHLQGNLAFVCASLD